MSKKPNIVIILCDTLRYDYFQEYLSANEDFRKRLQEFENFEQAYSPSSWTLPSHFSLFTGLYPSEHGVHESHESMLDEIFQKAIDYKGKFLTDIAKSNGYKTIGISSNLMISSITGFDRKFDEFYIVDTGKLSGYEISNSYKPSTQKLQLVLSRVLSNVRGFPKNKGYKVILDIFNNLNFSNPFFTFINLMEMHDPYFRNYGHIDDTKLILNDLFDLVPISGKKINNIRISYYKQIQKVAYTITRLLNVLKEKKVLENTVVIITSDHGQSLKERNFYGHGIFLYDELIHIPMLVKPTNYISMKLNCKSCVNLVDVHNFLEAVISGDNNSVRFLERDLSYAEVFGVQYSKQKLKTYIKSREALMKYEMINIPRKAIISSNYKLTINSNSGVEEFYTTKLTHQIDQNEIKEIIFNLSIFNLDKGFRIDEEQIISKTWRGK